MTIPSLAYQKAVLSNHWAKLHPGGGPDQISISDPAFDKMLLTAISEICEQTENATNEQCARQAQIFRTRWHEASLAIAAAIRALIKEPKS